MAGRALSRRRRPARAAGHYARAAEIAATLLAFDHAADLYQRALGFIAETAAERFRLLVGRADALANAGRGQLAAEAYQQAVAMAPADEALELERRRVSGSASAGTWTRDAPCWPTA